MTGALRLRFCGVSCAVEGDGGVEAQLRRDFASFLDPDARDAPTVRLGAFLHAPPPVRIPDRDPVLCGDDSVAWDDGPVRYVRYRGGALAILEYAAERGTLYATDPALLHELAYLLVLSRVGERLDRNGVHRVHALGLAKGDTAVLCFLPSGGGKTTLGLAVLHRMPSIRLLSDDTPLVRRDGTVLPFPMRLGVCRGEVPAWVDTRFVRPFARRHHGPKDLIDVSCLPNGTAGPCRRAVLLVGSRRPVREARIESMPRRAAASSVLWDMVFGSGLPQVVEFFLRRDRRDLAAKALIALGRACTGLRLLRRSAVWRFRLGDDAQRNADALVSFLSSL